MFIFIILLTLHACGLPTYPYLFPPELVITRNNPEDISEMDLIFKNAYKNNPSIFEGYEIYYKIYDQENAPGQYETDITKISLSDVTADNLTLENLSFKRLYMTDSSDLSSITHSSKKPSFAIRPDLLDEEFNIKLQFLQALADSFYAETYNSTFSFSSKPYMYRRVVNESTSSISNKYFYRDDFSINDSDVPSSVNISLVGSEHYFYITFYVLSYGLDAENITNSIYSVPLYLGTLKFDCNITND